MIMQSNDAALNLATLWERIADAIPDEVALISGDRRVTWREFEHRAARMASAFAAAGLGPGCKIAIDLYNCALLRGARDLTRRLLERLCVLGRQARPKSAKRRTI